MSWIYLLAIAVLLCFIALAWYVLRLADKLLDRLFNDELDYSCGPHSR